MATEHEVRIALVLNGGVSLAVWMGGVTHELDLIRRASGSAKTPDSQPYDEVLADRWRALCHQGEERRRVVVDVIAGTSAGGLNGSLLATAIANGSTLDPDGGSGPWLRQKWIGLGSLDVGKLVPPADVKATSVLDGNYFLRQLELLLKEVADAGESKAEEPVTLFVTASGLGLQQFEAKDAAGQAFVVPDHRYLYGFTSEHAALYDGTQRKFSFQDKNGLKDTELLARAARASASFPIAFGPVLETPELAASPPRMEPARTAGSWLIDGGVLDNAPFGPVLDVVARRPVTTKATRYVLYVVPSAGVGKAATALTDAKEPSWRVPALSAIQFPREVDFRSDVEQLERLLLEADASWSDSQRLFDRCLKQPAERDRLKAAAVALQPAYSRGRAAGGIWEAVTIAGHDQATVLDAATALSEAEIDEVLTTRHPWVPDPDGSTAVFRDDGEGNPSWLWGTGAAERVVRLILRSLRTQLRDAGTGRAELERQLTAASDCLLKVQAVRDALNDVLLAAGLDLRPAGGAEAVAIGLNDIFEQLQIQRALGDAFTALIAVIGCELVDIALEVEVVSRCTSARTPQQRSAPFQFLRLGPDVPMTLLDELPEGSLANQLGDRILYGSQVGHFGAFGAADWRRWDWLMGRLHCVAHLGAMLGADEDWIRETQRQVLRAEDWKLEAVGARVKRLAEDFPEKQGLGALVTMRNELNESPEGRAITKGLADRMVAVSGGVTPQVGNWVKATVGRKNQPGSWLLKTARWFTEPSRQTLWERTVHGVKLTPAHRPLIFEPWLPAATAAVGIGLLIVAGVVDQGAVRVVSAVLAGAVLTASAVLGVVTYSVRRARRKIQAGVAKLMPEISPASRSR
jgi:predicted acylesterase/phospholipase RssA